MKEQNHELGCGNEYKFLLLRELESGKQRKGIMQFDYGQGMTYNFLFNVRLYLFTNFFLHYCVKYEKWILNQNGTNISNILICLQQCGIYLINSTIDICFLKKQVRALNHNWS